jgi:TetR/AcrR family transcriptional regulator, regulator of cefoperazone and chloramphenicol sensitivity
MEIIEVAGRLFAEQGYDGTTSKSISERANVSLAAVNYYFESRDGLYLAVLKEVHRRFMSLKFLHELSDSPLSPADKLRRFLEALVSHVLESDSWVMRVWAREVLAPTRMFEKIVREDSWPKFEALADIIGAIAGIAVHDPRMPRLVLSTIAPCLIMLITNRETDTPVQPLYSTSSTALAEGFWRFAMAGLSQLAKEAAIR